MTTSVQPSRIREILAYRTIDLITVATLGVAFGVVFWGWGKLYEGISTLAVFGFPPSAGLLGGPWLLAGVVGGIIIRKPGAALATELVAAGVEGLMPGNQWGMSVLASGFLQGIGAELIIAVFLYKRFGVVIAVLAGILAGSIESVYEWQAYYPDWDLPYRLAHLGFFALSGAVVAGLGGWALTRALARAGVLDSFGPGREAAHEV